MDWFWSSLFYNLSLGRTVSRGQQKIGGTLPLRASKSIQSGRSKTKTVCGSDLMICYSSSAKNHPGNPGRRRKIKRRNWERLFCVGHAPAGINNVRMSQSWSCGPELLVPLVLNISSCSAPCCCCFSSASSSSSSSSCWAAVNSTSRLRWRLPVWFRLWLPSLIS